MNRFGVLNLLIATGLAASVSAIDCNSRPEKTDMNQCCPHDNLIAEDIVDTCKTYLEDNVEPPTGGFAGGPRGPGGPGVRGGRGGPGNRSPTCYMECALNETGILNGEDIDEEKLKSYLSTVFSASPDFVPVVQGAFVRCAEHAKEMRAMMENNPPPTPPLDMDSRMCKPCSAMLFHCVELETLNDCPSSAWKNDEACNNNREFFKNCKPPRRHGRPPM